MGLKIIKLSDNSYASSIGLLEGDILDSCNTVALNKNEDLVELVQNNLGEDLVFVILRGNFAKEIKAKGKPLGVEITPVESNASYAQNADEVQSISSVNRSRHNSAYESDYGTARWVAKFISFLGWLVFIGGMLVALIGLVTGMEVQNRFGNSGGVTILSLLPGFGISIAGLFLVAAGQVTRATVDSADHAREILRVLRKKA